MAKLLGASGWLSRLILALVIISGSWDLALEVLSLSSSPSASTHLPLSV